MQVEGTVMAIMIGSGKGGNRRWGMAQVWDETAKQIVKVFFDPDKHVLAEGVVGTFTVRPTDETVKFRLVGEVGSNA